MTSGAVTAPDHREISCLRQTAIFTAPPVETVPTATAMFGNSAFSKESWNVTGRMADLGSPHLRFGPRLSPFRAYASISGLLQLHHAQAGMVPRLFASPATSGFRQREKSCARGSCLRAACASRKDGTPLRL